MQTGKGGVSGLPLEEIIVKNKFKKKNPSYKKRKARTETFTKLEQKFGNADRLAPSESALRIRARGLRLAITLVQARRRRRLDLQQAMCHPARDVLVHANGAQDGMHFAFQFAVTRALHARLSRTAEIPIVITFRLRCEKAADAH